MIASLPVTAQAPVANVATISQSEEGRTLFEEWRRYDESTQRPWTLSSVKRELFEDLREVALEASDENWDGCGAAAVIGTTVQNAAAFILALPQNFCKPELGVSPSGDISFDWAQSANRVVSVAISDNREVSYGWIKGQEHGNGGYPFTEAFDPDLYRCIQDVLG